MVASFDVAGVTQGSSMVVYTDPIKDRAGLERKLAIDSYNVDPNRAHIRIIDHDTCLQCERQQCINCCPAACYAPQPDGRVIFSYEGCVECGTCRIVCNEFDNIAWTYPRGGFGIQYRFG
jgi:ferredoxin like protein